MSTILCFGDSNVWGNIPASFDPISGLCKRYERAKRWTGVLQNELGEKYHVVEEAINGRTTTLDEIIPGRPYKNGLTLLLPTLESHYPIDIVVFMLGTNDTKVQYNRSAGEITEGMRQLVKVVKTSNKGNKGDPPKILLIAPQAIIRNANLPPMFDEDSIKKSEDLGEKYRQLAKEESCEFLDASLVATSSHLDSLHLDETGTKSLGKAIARVIYKMK
jgi:lysophospholipase L1-like esterase